VGKTTAKTGGTLVVAADPSELAGVISHGEEVVRLQWPVGWCHSAKLAGRRLVLVANGPGELLAEEAFDIACRMERPGAVISTGFCGALNPDMRPGEILVATRIESVERGSSLAGERPRTSREYRVGTLLTASRVVRTAAEKEKLWKRGGDAVDMEAAALGERVVGEGLPFYCIRAVTDVAGEDFVSDFNAARGPDGRFRSWKIVWNALRRPQPCLPELWKLRGRAKLAAARLGEFLADCQF